MDRESRDLRLALHQLRALQRQIRDHPRGGIRAEFGQRVRQVVQPVADALPEFDDRALGLYRPGTHDYYDRDLLAAYVGLCIATLELALEGMEEVSPVTSAPDLSFIASEELRAMVWQDYEEILKCHATRSWKGAILLTGSCLEGILLDLVLGDRESACSSASAPRDDPDRWNLADLVSVCEELGKINAGQVSLSGAVREYRNLIHPGRALRVGIPYGEEEAVIGLKTLNALVRDLGS